MRKITVLLICFLFASKAISSMIINDNLGHTIDYEINEDIGIDYGNSLSTPENHTSVELVDGGQVNSVYTYEYGELVINGGVVDGSSIGLDNSLF